MDLNSTTKLTDVLAFVRRTLWANNYFRTSVEEDECILFPHATWEEPCPINWLLLLSTIQNGQSRVDLR